MAKKISVIIPNYNGRDLLVKNLPRVIQNFPGCEIIVVDDASSDDSVEFVKKNFGKIKVFSTRKNCGFANAVNFGVKKAGGDLAILLNSDAVPRANFLNKALNYFTNDDIFAVGFCDYSHENGKIVTRGRGGAKFKRGMLSHFAAESETGETLWVSGGSAIVDRNKFLELGGFDKNFAPFYWEDIDLCFRAWRRGYRCIFDSDLKVDHFHEEGAIRKEYSPFFIKTVSYKNQFIFVWKNIADVYLIFKHLVCLPYHFITALLRFDSAFFAGFIWACVTVPKLIFDDLLSIANYKFSEKEVINKFEKP